MSKSVQNRGYSAEYTGRKRGCTRDDKDGRAIEEESVGVGGVREAGAEPEMEVGEGVVGGKLEE